MRDQVECDVCIVGAGVAGLSLAAALAGRRRTVVLEAESQPGAQATGRSAALFTRTYGDANIRKLTVASERFFGAPPEGFAERALLKPRGCLYAARPDQAGVLADWAAGLTEECPSAVVLSSRELAPMQLPLTPEVAGAALWDPDAADVDVNALTMGFLKQARAAGGMLLTDNPLLSARRFRGGWTVETPSADIRCGVLVDAAGGWADEVARRSGVAELGLQPRRRSMVCVQAPEGAEVDKWPFIVDLDMTFYFKPETGRLIISPADETPCEPCDARPEELDVAIAIDRFERATGLAVRRVINRWAGLRTFASDENPVVGFDDSTEGFFWLAGQGGFGVQTAPAVAELACRALLDEPMSVGLTRVGLDAERFSPTRLRAGPLTLPWAPARGRGRDGLGLGLHE